MLFISVFKTEGNLTEYVYMLRFEHIILTDPVPVFNAASEDNIVAPINSFFPPYTTTLPLLYL